MAYDNDRDRDRGTERAAEVPLRTRKEAATSAAVVMTKLSGALGNQRLVQLARERDATRSEAIKASATAGIAGPSGPLPHLDMIQKSFGHHDVTAVQAHTDGAARQANAEIGSLAYASGDHVAMGAGTDLHTVAHEAAHVVQQRGGVQLKDGVGSAGDFYEQHADAVADRVVQGKSAQSLLDQVAPARQATSGAAVQLKEPPGGEKKKEEPDHKSFFAEKTTEIGRAKLKRLPTLVAALNKQIKRLRSRRTTKEEKHTAMEAIAIVGGAIGMVVEMFEANVTREDWLGVEPTLSVIHDAMKACREHFDHYKAGANKNKDEAERARAAYNACKPAKKIIGTISGVNDKIEADMAEEKEAAEAEAEDKRLDAEDAKAERLLKASSDLYKLALADTKKSDAAKIIGLLRRMKTNATQELDEEDYRSVSHIIHRLIRRHIGQGHGDVRPKFPGGLHRQFQRLIFELSANFPE